MVQREPPDPDPHKGADGRRGDAGQHGCAGPDDGSRAARESEGGGPQPLDRSAHRTAQRQLESRYKPEGAEHDLSPGLNLLTDADDVGPLRYDAPEPQDREPKE